MQRFWLTVRYLLGIHVLGLCVLTLFRVMQWLTLGDMSQSDDSVWPAMLRGVWFDNVVGCYILAVPLLAVLLAASFRCYATGWRRLASWFCGILYVLAFAVSAANIPYFQYFFKNINSSVFNWFGYAQTTAGMLVGDTSYLTWLLLFLVVASLYVVLLRLLRRRCDRQIARTADDRRSWANVGRKVAVTLVLTGLCIFGIRGRIGYNPIKISQAYYCNDPFLNQLGIAPTFNLLTSVMDDMRPENETLQLTDPVKAVTLTRKYLGLEGAVDPAHVLRRQIVADTTARPHNVVVILMESMSAALMHSLGARQQLTPVLDSLYDCSLAFTNFYSSGIHTNHGITASLYSFPAMMKRNLMKGTVTPHRQGLPTILHEAGYHTLFFMTHEAQYDNMNAFLLTNGYDDVYAQEDYPRSERVNAFGVPDRYLFQYALPVINRAAQGGKPFLATLLTISNHPPYIIPDGFSAKSHDEETQIVEYADRCIGDFLTAARRQPWYQNTVFVILADHGKLVGKADSELPQSYNHIPLIIFGPDVPVQRYDGLATQTDVMPTVLGLLARSYTTDGFGIDLLKHRHAAICYTADDQIVARDSLRCFIYKPASRQRFCYNVAADGSMKPDSRQHDYKDLESLAFSIIQTAEGMKREE